MDKREILRLVIESLQKEEKVLIDAALSAKVAATEAESKPENEYDTRGLEQSYLAGGQAKRVAELQESILNLQSLPLHAFESTTPIDLSALINLQSENGETKTYFLLSERGGIKVNYKGTPIYTLSPESPLAASLIGKRVGDSIEVSAKGFTIESIH